MDFGSRAWRGKGGGVEGYGVVGRGMEGEGVGV